MRRRGGPDPSHLSGLVRSALPKGAEERLALPEIRRIWAEIVGNALAKRTFVEDFYRGLVTARADSPASAKMISMRAGSIARELSKRSGMEVLSVKVTPGKISGGTPSVRRAHAPFRITPPREEVERCFEEVKDAFSPEKESVARRLASLMAVFRRRFPGS